MKTLFGILILIIALIASSAVFIHFSNRLMQPASADRYNSYFKKWDRSIVDICIDYKQKGLDYMNKCFELFDDSTPTNPDHARKCTDTCPLPRSRTKQLVTGTSRLKKGNSMETMSGRSNITRQASMRD
jgi:hypothetical protein